MRRRRAVRATVQQFRDSAGNSADLVHDRLLVSRQPPNAGPRTVLWIATMLSRPLAASLVRSTRS